MTTSLVIGDYEITAVLDSPAPLRDPAIIFPSVPPAAWDPYRSFALDPLMVNGPSTGAATLFALHTVRVR